MATREGRILISTSAGDPDFGSSYYVTGYEVGATVSGVWSGGSIPVDEGHGFAALDKFIVVSEFPATTKMRTVTSVTATTIVCASVSVVDGDILVNLGIDSETVAGTPDYNGSNALIYSDMDNVNVYADSTLQTDSTGRYRYFHTGIPRWELVRTSAGVPFALIMDTQFSGVGGVSSSTDNAVARWDGATGQALQNSVVIIADTTGDTTGMRDLSISRNFVATGDVSVGDDLTVTGTSALADVTVSTTLNVTGAITAGATLAVTGDITTSAAASVGTDLTVADDVSVGDVLTVGGTATISGHFMRSVAAAVTASTTQTQVGGTALTKDINNIATVANANDTVTLPSAVAGMMVSVFNNGAQTLRIYPASGDNLGTGVDTLTTLGSGSNITWVSFNAINWEIV